MTRQIKPPSSSAAPQHDVRDPMRKYSKPICRGSLLLGSGCGCCQKCSEERAKMVAKYAEADRLCEADQGQIHGDGMIIQVVARQPWVPKNISEAIGYAGGPEHDAMLASVSANELKKQGNDVCDRNADDVQALRIKIAHWHYLMGEVIDMATNAPQLLTAFNSPLMQMISIEHYLHNHPDADRDDEGLSIDKFREAYAKQKRARNVF